MEPTGGNARRMLMGNMTSEVKRGERLFFRQLQVFAMVSRKRWSQEDTTVAHADSRGLAPN
jgi:hypothetical protein